MCARGALGHSSGSTALSHIGVEATSEIVTMRMRSTTRSTSEVRVKCRRLPLELATDQARADERVVALDVARAALADLDAAHARVDRVHVVLRPDLVAAREGRRPRHAAALVDHVHFDQRTRAVGAARAGLVGHRRRRRQRLGRRQRASADAHGRAWIGEPRRRLAAELVVAHAGRLQTDWRPELGGRARSDIRLYTYLGPAERPGVRLRVGAPRRL